jgi:hypothetical protein
VQSGKNADRPGLSAALSALSIGLVTGLVTAKLDRLTRSVQDFGHLLTVAKAEGWALVLLDLGVDTSTPNGKLVANVVASMAEWERDIISARTKEGLAAKRAAGVTLGRRSGVPADVLRRIRREHAQGASYGAIARGPDRRRGAHRPRRGPLVPSNGQQTTRHPCERRAGSGPAACGRYRLPCPLGLAGPLARPSGAASSRSGRPPAA